MSATKRVRIQCEDGRGQFVKVIDPETGLDIADCIADIRIHMTPGTVAAVITTVMPAVDVIANAEIKQVCPHCGREEEAE